MQSQIMTVGQRVKFLRALSGVTQEELANKSSLSPNKIARIEQGRLEPFAGFHDSLAFIYNTRPAWTRDGVPPAFDQIGYFQFYPDSIFSIFSGKAIVRKMETLSEAFERFFPMFVAENGIAKYFVASQHESTNVGDDPQLDKVYAFHMSSPDRQHNAVLVLAAFDMSYDFVDAVIAETPLKKIREINLDYHIFDDLRTRTAKHCLALSRILNELGGLKPI